MKRDWIWLKKIGRRKVFQTQEELLELACEYFQMVDDTPFVKEELIKGGLWAGETGKVKLQRPYTWVGLESFLNEKGIISKLDNYRENLNGSYDEFQDALRVIENVMRTQKFDGASVGIFHAGIISTELGLIKKTEQTINIEQPLFPDADSLLD